MTQSSNIFQTNNLWNYLMKTFNSSRFLCPSTPSIYSKIVDASQCSFASSLRLFLTWSFYAPQVHCKSGFFHRGVFLISRIIGTFDLFVSEAQGLKVQQNIMSQQLTVERSVYVCFKVNSRAQWHSKVMRRGVLLRETRPPPPQPFFLEGLGNNFGFWWWEGQQVQFHPLCSKMSSNATARVSNVSLLVLGLCKKKIIGV